MSSQPLFIVNNNDYKNENNDEKLRKSTGEMYTSEKGKLVTS